MFGQWPYIKLKPNPITENHNDLSLLEQPELKNFVMADNLMKRSPPIRRVRAVENFELLGAQPAGILAKRKQSYQTVEDRASRLE